MNPRGRPGPGSEPRPGGGPPVVWALLVIAAALVGGLAAAALVHTSLIVAVLVAVIAGAVAIVVFRSPAAPPERLTFERPAPSRADFPDPRSRSAAPSAAAPTAPVSVTPASPAASASAGPAGPVVQLLPLQAQHQAGASWWDAAAGAALPSPSVAAQLAPAPDLSTYLASTFIAQCPACGAFRLDSRRTQDGWDFRCESCDYIWAWQPGTPWPPVRVMPARRRKPRPSPPDPAP